MCVVSDFRRRDRQLVLNFAAEHHRIHFHLDWEPLPTWIADMQNHIALGWQDDRLVAAMAFSPGHQRTGWLRMLALPYENRAECFLALWQHLQPRMSPHIQTIAAMTNRAWLVDLLPVFGFAHTDTVINLARRYQPLPDVPLAGVHIRKPRWFEFNKVLELDNTAFQPLWQLRAGDLREVSRRAYHYRVATDGGNLIGYQLSMRYRHSLHLARLATLPAYQGQHIGKTLLYHLLQDATDAGIHEVTVNTQASNLASRRVYDQFGFENLEDDYPVFTYALG